MPAYQPLFTAIPTDRQKCWSCLAEFAEFWHRTACPSIDYMRPVLQTESRLHITIPAALIEWHTRFGRFINLWCERAFTIPINKLRIQDGKLIVRSERVFNGMLEANWGIPIGDLDTDDPKVVSVLGEKEYPCAERLSQFAIYCAVFDTINSHHTSQHHHDNDVPFPSNGKRMQFPSSFGVIKTEMYEGENWIAMVSGTDWYLRRRNAETDTDEFVRHELRTKGLPA